MITIITKMVPTRYYILDGVEFEGNKLLETLDNIVNVFDSWVSEFEVDWRCAENFLISVILIKNIFTMMILYITTQKIKKQKPFLKRF